MVFDILLSAVLSTKWGCVCGGTALFNSDGGEDACCLCKEPRHRGFISLVQNRNVGSCIRHAHFPPSSGPTWMALAIRLGFIAGSCYQIPFSFLPSVFQSSKEGKVSLLVIFILGPNRETWNGKRNKGFLSAVSNTCSFKFSSVP